MVSGVSPKVETPMTPTTQAIEKKGNKLIILTQALGCIEGRKKR